MQKNVLFRGCTRPAMFMGVPYLAFFVGAGVPFLLSVYVNWFCLLLAPLVIMTMRQMARRDEMIFRLLGLSWQFKFRARNVQQHGGMWVFTPNPYRKVRPGEKRNLGIPALITGRMTGPVAKPAATVKV